MLLNHLINLITHRLKFELLPSHGLSEPVPLSLGLLQPLILVADHLLSLLPGLLPLLLPAAYESLEFGVHSRPVLVRLVAPLHLALSHLGLDLAQHVLRVLERDLDLIHELSTDELLLLTDSLDLHS